VQVHPVIPGIGEVDLLIGVLIIETDGKRFHLGAQFDVDRDRDLAAARLGYRVLRLRYHQVMEDWPITFAAIGAVLAAAA
jgi:very-short-patch-repair endonuclease